MTETAPAAPAAPATAPVAPPPSAPAAMPTPATTTAPAVAPADNGSLLTDTTTETTPGAEAAPESPPATETAVEYTDFKMPEGVTIADEALGEFKTLAKEAGLSQEKAQTLLDQGMKLLKQSEQSATDYYKKMNDQWRSDVEKDVEIGGKNFDAVKASFSKALASVTNAAENTEFRQMLSLTGAGNHPIFIKIMSRLSKAFNEGSHISGNPSSKPMSDAHKVYPPKSTE